MSLSVREFFLKRKNDLREKLRLGGTFALFDGGNVVDENATIGVVMGSLSPNAYLAQAENDRPAAATTGVWACCFGPQIQC